MSQKNCRNAVQNLTTPIVRRSICELVSLRTLQNVMQQDEKHLLQKKFIHNAKKTKG